MTTRRRSALQELTTPDAMYNEEILHDSPNGMLSQSLVSPVLPSPDELIIRQRGRRSISLTWSPTRDKKKCSPMKTPTKNVSSMILRSSPRKRLLLSDSCSSPRKITDSPRKYPSPSNLLECTKRLKIEEKSIAQIDAKVPLSIHLKGYSQEQLVAIIQKLVKEEPELEKKIRCDLPLADIKPLETQLMFVKKCIYKSLPASRLVKKNDSVAYSRAAMHLGIFKKTIMEQSNMLYDSKHYDSLMDYIMMAWNFVRSTPVWENHSHNSIRRQCFKILSYHCLASLQYGGVYLGKERLQQFSNQIRDMSVDCESITTCFLPLEYLLKDFVNH